MNAETLLATAVHRPVVGLCSIAASGRSKNGVAASTPPLDIHAAGAKGFLFAVADGATDRDASLALAELRDLYYANADANRVRAFHEAAGLAAARLSGVAGGWRTARDRVRENNAGPGPALAAVLCYRRGIVTAWMGAGTVFRIRGGGIVAAAGKGSLPPVVHRLDGQITTIGRSSLDLSIAAVEIQPGDRVVMGTGGLAELLQAGEILELVRGLGPKRSAEALADLARKRGWNDALGTLVVTVPPLQDAPESPRAAAAAGRYGDDRLDADKPYGDDRLGADKPYGDDRLGADGRYVPSHPAGTALPPAVGTATAADQRAAATKEDTSKLGTPRERARRQRDAAPDPDAAPAGHLEAVAPAATTPASAGGATSPHVPPSVAPAATAPAATAPAATAPAAPQTVGVSAPAPKRTQKAERGTGKVAPTTTGSPGRKPSSLAADSAAPTSASLSAPHAGPTSASEAAPTSRQAGPSESSWLGEPSGPGVAQAGVLHIQPASDHSATARPSPDATADPMSTGSTPPVPTANGEAKRAASAVAMGSPGNAPHGTPEPAPPAAGAAKKRDHGAGRAATAAAAAVAAAAAARDAVSRAAQAAGLGVTADTENATEDKWLPAHKASVSHVRGSEVSPEPGAAGPQQAAGGAEVPHADRLAAPKPDKIDPAPKPDKIDPAPKPDKIGPSPKSDKIGPSPKSDKIGPSPKLGSAKPAAPTTTASVAHGRATSVSRLDNTADRTEATGREAGRADVDRAWASRSAGTVASAPSAATDAASAAPSAATDAAATAAASPAADTGAADAEPSYLGLGKTSPGADAAAGEDPGTLTLGEATERQAWNAAMPMPWERRRPRIEATALRTTAARASGSSTVSHGIRRRLGANKATTTDKSPVPRLVIPVVVCVAAAVPLAGIALAGAATGPQLPDVRAGWDRFQRVLADIDIPSFNLPAGVAAAAVAPTATAASTAATGGFAAAPPAATYTPYPTYTPPPTYTPAATLVAEAGNAKALIRPQVPVAPVAPAPASAVSLLGPVGGVVGDCVKFNWLTARPLNPGERLALLVCSGSGCQPRNGISSDSPPVIWGPSDTRGNPDLSGAPGSYRWAVAIEGPIGEVDRSPVSEFAWSGGSCGGAARAARGSGESSGDQSSQGQRPGDPILP